MQTEKELRQANDNMRQILQSKLMNLNNAVSKAAGKIAVSGLSGDETRSILSGLCRKYPYLLDCSTADQGGRLVTVEPEAYRRFEGVDTATTEASKKYQADAVANRKPMLRDVFRVVEGVDAVVLTWPVITTQDELVGFVGALFKPGDMLSGTTASAAELRAIEVYVLQTNGLVIYCSSVSEIGKNVLTDQQYKDYPGMEAMGKKLVAEKTGTYKYSFPSAVTGQPEARTIVWNTLELNGTEWRLASVAELKD